MTDSVSLIAKRGDGFTQTVDLTFSTSPPHSIQMTRAGHAPVSYEGDHLTACLRKLRKDLEAEGFLLCCQGARPDIVLSGMQAQMTDGRFAYTFNPASRTINDETVDIFAPASAEDVVTTDEQRAETFRFYGLEDRGGQQ
ncbi:hypothetical protein ACWC5C_38145 [Streptomyces sp. NPDC001700]